MNAGTNGFRCRSSGSNYYDSLASMAFWSTLEVGKGRDQGTGGPEDLFPLALSMPEQTARAILVMSASKPHACNVVSCGK